MICSFGEGGHETRDVQKITHCIFHLQRRYQMASYSFRNVFNDVNSLAEGYIFSNFNSIASGNSQLENALTKSHSLNYSKYDLFNFTTIFGRLAYNSTKNPVVNGIRFQNIYSISDRLNLNVENENVNGNLFYSRSFKKFYKVSANINGNWNKNNVLNFLND